MIGSFNLDGKQIPLLCICLFFPFSFGLRSLPCILQDKAGSTSLTETTHTGVQIRVGLFICFIFNSQKYANFEGSFLCFNGQKTFLI